MRYKLAVHTLQFTRRKGRCEYGAPALGLKVFDNGQGHVLHFFLTLEKVHVLHKQHIKFAKTGFKAFNILRAQRGHKARGKFLGGEVAHARIAALFVDGAPNGLGKVCLAKTRCGIYKQGTNTTMPAADVLRCGHGHIIGGANDKIRKGIAPVLRAAKYHGRRKGK